MPNKSVADIPFISSRLRALLRNHGIHGQRDVARLLQQNPNRLQDLEFNLTAADKATLKAYGIFP